MPVCLAHILKQGSQILVEMGRNRLSRHVGDLL